MLQVCECALVVSELHGCGWHYDAETRLSATESRKALGQRRVLICSECRLGGSKIAGSERSSIEPVNEVLGVRSESAKFCIQVEDSELQRKSDAELLVQALIHRYPA